MHLAVNAYFWNEPATGSGQYTRQLIYHLNRHVSDLEITLIYPHEEDPAGVPPSVRTHRAAARPGHLGKVVFPNHALQPSTWRQLHATTPTAICC